MGSCVPPRDCAGKTQSYRKPTNQVLIDAAVSAVSVPNDPWILGTASSPTIKFAALDKLSKDFWKASLPIASWENSSEEDTRVFMLERLIAQSLSVEKDVSVASSKKLLVKWKNITSHLIDEPIIDPNSRSQISNLFNGPDEEATDQIKDFANYLYWAVKTELGADDARVEAIIDLVGTCLEGIGNLVYVGKALTGFRRPPHPHFLPTPRISTLPGGHAYYSGAIATLLYVVLTKDRIDVGNDNVRKSIATRLATMAQRIAINRERAALHYVEDSEVGLRWGFKVMGKVLLEARADADAEAAAATATPGTRAVPGTLSDLYKLILQVA